MTSFPRSVVLLLLALAATACGKAPAPAAAPTATAIPEVCVTLQKRIAHCQANVKQGHFEFQFDAGATKEPALCEEANKMLDSIVQTTGCES